MSSNGMTLPFRRYSITLAANETRPVPHGRAVSFHLPRQVAGKSVPTDSLEVAFGESAEYMPVSEGVFISAPGIEGEGWKVTVLRNLSGSPIMFDYVLSADPALLILVGS